MKKSELKVSFLTFNCMHTLMNWMWERKTKGKNSWMKEQMLP